MLRSHKLDEVNEDIANQNVELCGWIDSIRVMKNLIFIVLRDRYGKVQCIVPKSVDNFESFKELTIESSIKIKGVVNMRPENQFNEDMASGKIEVRADSVEAFNIAPVLPMDLKNDNNDEDTRLKNRFLDLRTDRMQRNLKVRSDIMFSVLDYFRKQDFAYIETPILGKSTPEGARDFVVPSRKHPGEFYALPQSPQLFKQLSQVAGFDKYIQIARCFRDEDSRKDRQPEFTQIDLEMSFIEQEDVLNIIEGMVAQVFKEVRGIELKIPFSRITYEEAMKKYGRDNPDTRPDTGEEFSFTWVVDFPAFEHNEEENRYKAVHHPFTQPVLDENGEFNEKSLSYGYDLVLNGSEIGGGSIRIHNDKIQSKVFDILKISPEEAEEKFGFLLKALSYGAPPHGGFAFGLDRLAQILTGEESIREVIAFPKNKDAVDLMLDSPSALAKEQLTEVGLDLLKKEEKKE
ncbi:MAG: OB-fold nucleic acid binding domain-containing protein [Nanoarchaeota archaeon]|jgi:aspartyl-tRNA synthetase|nr:OB-fold nucleic acid binding domain-containing protein [Nanoarchaeota archaeon]